MKALRGCCLLLVTCFLACLAWRSVRYPVSNGPRCAGMLVRLLHAGDTVIQRRPRTRMAGSRAHIRCKYDD